MANYDGVASANIKMNNSDDATRAYDISAEFIVDGGNIVINVISGKVLKGDTKVATFFKSTNRKDVSWMEGVDTEVEQNAINSAITAFINACISTITNTNPLSI